MRKKNYDEEHNPGLIGSGRIERLLDGAEVRAPVSYTHLTLPTNREV